MKQRDTLPCPLSPALSTCPVSPWTTPPCSPITPVWLDTLTLGDLSDLAPLVRGRACVLKHLGFASEQVWTALPPPLLHLVLGVGGRGKVAHQASAFSPVTWLCLPEDNPKG